MSVVQSEPLAFGPKVGSFLGFDIHDWLEMPDGRYEYHGTAPGPAPGCVDLDRLGPDEICVTPGLLYKKSPT